MGKDMFPLFDGVDFSVFSGMFPCFSAGFIGEFPQPCQQPRSRTAAMGDFSIVAQNIDSLNLFFAGLFFRFDGPVLPAVIC